MQQQEKPFYKWMAKRGSILLFKDNHTIHIELDKESSETCLLTKEDTEEIITIMTSLAGAIWDSPDFMKEPYEAPLYKKDENTGLVYWDIAEKRLYIGFNRNEDAVEINHSGDAVLKVAVNYAVEIIQILTQVCKQFKA